ncbi:MAG: ATP-binding cassette domain-containing protein [Bacillota bacterium]
MIKLKNINKYYNKNKNNEIHVINHTSIDFPEKGLVAITGPSGCGKTTLLNVIAGLDSFSSGEIIYDDVKISKYKPNVVDEIRNRKIGYIFQNYNLLSDQTVYQNIATSLNIAGLYDKEDLEQRINYSLEKVGMYNYRKRSVLALSGGQQQRIGIARAIAKNPEVILADEPTGNLDSNNTFEVMSLIKNISKTKLVILVTHERDLVDYYADRIIELKDGLVINDYKNFKNKAYQHIDERYIYLKDLNQEDLSDEYIDYYYDSKNDKKFNIKVVEMNDGIYIKAASDKKITYVSDDAEIKLLDEHKKEDHVEEMEPLNFDDFEKIDYHHKKSLFRWKDTLLNGFKKLFSRKKFSKKLMIFVYFVISGVIAVQLALLGNIFKVDEGEFLFTPKNSISVDKGEDLNYNDLIEINEVEGVSFPFYQQTYFDVIYRPVYQAKIQTNFSSYPIKESWVKNPEFIAGIMPENDLEVVISSYVAKMILNRYSFAEFGFEEEKDLIGLSLSSEQYSLDFEIVGVIETNERIIVLKDSAYPLFKTFDYGFSPVSLYEDKIDILSGDSIENENEIIVHTDSDYTLDEEVTLYDNFSNVIGNYTVVGTFEYNQELNIREVNIIMSNEEFENIVIENASLHDGFRNLSEYNFYADDIDLAISELEQMGYEVEDLYESSREDYISQRTAQYSTRITTLLIMLGGIILFIYFVMKSSMINRVEEIGIYRAIGATKRDVYKIFLSEILVYTTIASITGYLLMAYIVNSIEKQLGAFQSNFYLPFWLLFSGILAIYLINIIFGLLPIYRLLRKTPAEILAKYDI